METYAIFNLFNTRAAISVHSSLSGCPAHFGTKYIYLGLQKIGNLCQKYRRKIGNYQPKNGFLITYENHNNEQIAARKQRPREFKA